MRLPAAVARRMVGEFRAAGRDACRLAVAVSAAVQVEPALLRRARLDLCPGLAAGVESDVWWSSLVGSRSTRSIVFEPAVLEQLREELAGKLAEECGGDEARFRRYRRVVREVHREAPAAIQLEEEIVWLALTGGDQSAPAIERALRRAIRTMVHEPGRAAEVARWADRALTYFPASVRRAAAARLLASGSAAHLGAAARVVAGGQASAADGAAWLGPEATGSRVTVRVRRFVNALELDTGGGSPDGPAGTLELSPADAVVLDLFRLEGGEELPLGPVTPGPGVLVALSAWSGDLLLRTVSGQEYRVALERPVPATPGGRRLRVYVSFLKADRELVDWLHREVQEAGHETFWVDYEEAQGEEWERRVADALERADLFLYVVTPRSVENSLTRRELELALAREARRGEPTGWFAAPVLLEEVDEEALGRLPPFRMQMVRDRLQLAGLLASAARVAPQAKPKSVFLSYGASDDWVKRVKSTLAPLESEGLLEIWDMFSAGDVGGAEERIENTDLILVLINERYFTKRGEWNSVGGLIRRAAERGVPVAWLAISESPEPDSWLARSLALLRFDDPPGETVPLTALETVTVDEAFRQLPEIVRNWAEGRWEIPSPTAEEIEDPRAAAEDEPTTDAASPQNLEWALEILAALGGAFHHGAVEGPELWGEAPRLPGDEGFPEERLFGFYGVRPGSTAANDLLHVRQRCASLFGEADLYLSDPSAVFRHQGRGVIDELVRKYDSAEAASDYASGEVRKSAQREVAYIERQIVEIALQVLRFADEEERGRMVDALGFDPSRLSPDELEASLGPHEVEKLIEIAPHYTAPFHSWFRELPTSLQRAESFLGYLDAFFALWDGYCQTAQSARGAGAAVELGLPTPEGVPSYRLKMQDIDRLRKLFPGVQLETDRPAEIPEAPGGSLLLTSLPLADYARIVEVLGDRVRAGVRDSQPPAA